MCNFLCINELIVACMNINVHTY
ncbi:hypothetical protein DRO64_02050 [Candidatus Bathyarchaeota archaeon]|nr:MAG: hypothetical protein DRO64_02050 [Candidatus Bathyarchaeota archaeon]